MMASLGAGLNTGEDNDECLPPLETLSNYNKSLRKQVESAKLELEHHFQLYHRMLYDKQEHIISQLDAVLMSANDLYKKRSELIQTQGELEEKVKSNRFHDMKVKMLEPLLAEMSELERSISRSERKVLELEWKDSQLEAAIEKSCVVLKNTSISYEDRQVPVWSVGSKRDGEGQVREARGLAIDSENEDIYIADWKNHLIVVFNRDGNFQRNIKVDKMNRPHSILLIDEYCFIACNIPKEGLIVKVNKRTGVLGAIFKPGLNITALALDKENCMLVGCLVTQPLVWYFKRKDLGKVSEMQLHTTNFKHDTQIYAMESRENEIFILFYKPSSSPLQSFSRDGKLLRDMIIPAGVIKGALFFTIDSQQNFIISDNYDNKVKVFSPTGELIARIGKDMTEEGKEGKLYGPRGIALTRDGSIVVCDEKRRNLLQIF